MIDIVERRKPNGAIKIEFLVDNVIGCCTGRNRAKVRAQVWANITWIVARRPPDVVPRH